MSAGISLAGCIRACSKMQMEREIRIRARPSSKRRMPVAVRERLTARAQQQTLPVAMRYGETPVPIPNTTVKTIAAESTIRATVWEDRWLPDFLN